MKNPLQFNARHIFRAILRETSYHPDPKARVFLKEYAIDAYRRQQAKAAVDWPTWDPPDIARRETNLLRRARRLLSSLRAANNGYLDPFRRSLQLTYGRIGQRKRMLMRQVMAQPPSADDDSAAQPGQAESTDLSMTSRDWRPTPFFHALHNTQASVHRYLQVPKRLRTQAAFEPDIPKATIWERPLPGKRIEKNWRLWLSREARAVFPPLPHVEVEYIRSIAAGEIVLQRVTRRSAAKVPVFATDEALDLTSAEEQGLNILADPVLRKRSKGRGPPHRLTPRYLQRTYAWLLLRCPMAHKPVPTDAPGSIGPTGSTDVFKSNAGNAKKDEILPLGKKAPLIEWQNARKGVLHVQTVSGKVADALFGQG
jgi:hypothetical protein